MFKACLFFPLPPPPPSLSPLCRDVGHGRGARDVSYLFKCSVFIPKPEKTVCKIYNAQSSCQPTKTQHTHLSFNPTNIYQKSFLFSFSQPVGDSYINYKDGLLFSYRPLPSKIK